MNAVIQLNNGNRGVQAAFTYDAATKSLLPMSDRVAVENGLGFWAITIDGDYALIFDLDGLLVGDFEPGPVEDYPRLDFYTPPGASGVGHWLASLTKSGRLCAAGLIESDTLPADSVNLYDNIALTPDGIIASRLSEIFLLATTTGDYICHEGQLIQL